MAEVRLVCDGFDTGDRTFRCALFVGMVGVAALSAGVDGAAHGDSGLFVISYASLLLVLAALYARTWLLLPGMRRLAGRQVRFIGASGTFAH